MLIHYPVKQTTISQPFGRDTADDPVYKSFYTSFDNKHCGVDFPVSVGTDVFASFEGIVVRREFHKGMGNVLGIRNGNIVSLYAHLSRFNVDLGNVIAIDSLIGQSGNTGDALVEPHLHFELRDISKSNLKDMVFDPPFGSEVQNHCDQFTYKVNNANTIKTLRVLSKMYFGTEKLWERIKIVNNLNIKGDSVLTEGVQLVIPNYK
jgi:murein DD-endopeptidase MepM/ murein hydrolase activator NlpD